MSNVLPSRPHKRDSKTVDLKWLVFLIASVSMISLITASAKFGSEMARQRLPEKSRTAEPQFRSEFVTLGSSDSPIFLANSPETVRRFFSEHPTTTARSGANLNGWDIRRLQSNVEIAILGTEAEAVEVRISSGAIAGTVYWVHHSQLPDTEVFDPIISPIPKEISQPEK
jgi:hypothetical protein